MAQTYAEHLAKCKECHKRTHDERIMWGLCFRCGKPLTDEKTLQCKSCLAKEAERREKNREKYREYQRRRIAEHRAKGLCLLCDSPAAPNRVKCEYHLKYGRMIDHKRSKKRSEAKQCAND